jgi:hypothetical protein
VLVVEVVIVTLKLKTIIMMMTKIIEIITVVIATNC